jgi:hypothetical protein
MGAATLVLKAALDDSRIFPAVENHAETPVRREHA